MPSPEEGQRPDQQQENPGQQPELIELAKAREALIVFVASTERTSARSKAFSNQVSKSVISQLPDPGEPVREYTGHVQWLMSDEATQLAKHKRRVETNTALVKGYSLERARVLVRLRAIFREWRDGPGRHYEYVNEASAYPRELQEIRAEVFARQQHARQAPPQE